MRGSPEWLDLEELMEQIDERRERRQKAQTRRGRCLVALDTGDIDQAERAKREFQLAAYETRQSEGEILWGAIGQATTDFTVRGIDSDDGRISARGDALVEWAVDADMLASVRDEDRVLLIVARRFPTAPAAHEPYLKRLFDLDDAELSARREQDRRMLEIAGWLRRGRTDVSETTLVDCPHCGYCLPAQISEGDSPRASMSFSGSDDEMREICPHCERDIFISPASNSC